MPAYPDSWLELANLAIGRIGKPAIATMDEGNATANFVNLYLGEVIDAVLDVANWRCLLARADFARLSSVPAFGYLYEYQLPVGFHHPVAVEMETSDYEIEGDRLLTDSSYVRMIFTRRPDDPAVLSPWVYKLIVCELAVRLTTPLTSSEGLIQRLMSERNDQLVIARRSEARLGPDLQPEAARGYAYSEELRG